MKIGKFNNNGAALVWAICASAIVLILLGGTLTLAQSYHARTVRESNEKQAYFTARSAVDSIITLLCDDTTYTTKESLFTSSSLIPQQNIDGAKVSIDSMFAGFDMGECNVDIEWVLNPLSNQKENLKVTAYATYHDVPQTVSAIITYESKMTNPGNVGGQPTKDFIFYHSFFHFWFYNFYKQPYFWYMPTYQTIRYHPDRTVLNNKKLTSAAANLESGKTYYWIYQQNDELNLEFKFAPGQTGPCTVYLVNDANFKADTEISYVQSGVKLYYYGLNPFTELTLGGSGQDTLITGGIFAREHLINILGNVTINGCFYPDNVLTYISIGRNDSLKLQITTTADDSEPTYEYQWKQLKYSDE